MAPWGHPVLVVERRDGVVAQQAVLRPVPEPLLHHVLAAHTGCTPRYMTIGHHVSAWRG
jgi:hypothetical protein